MRPLIAALALIAALPAIAQPARKPVREAWDRTAPTVTAAEVKLNPAPGRPAAGYFTLAGGGQPDTLVAVTSPLARVELHSMTMAGGVMQMRRLDGVAVPAGQVIRFAPGGNHLMLFDLHGTPTSVPLTFVFKSGARVAATASVGRIGTTSPMTGHQNPGHDQH